MAYDIEALAQGLASLGTQTLLIEPGACTWVRNRHSACRRCFDVCPHGALRLKDGDAVIDSDQCLGCGICAAVCPTQALVCTAPTTNQLMDAVRDILRSDFGAGVAFARTDTVQKHLMRGDGADLHGIIELPSLSRLDAAVLIELAARGVRHFSIVIPQGPWADADLQVLDSSIQTACEVTGACGQEFEVSFLGDIDDWGACNSQAPSSYLRGFIECAVETAGNADQETKTVDNVPQATSEAAGLAGETPGEDDDAQDDPGVVELPLVAHLHRMVDGHLPYVDVSRHTRIYNCVKRLSAASTVDRSFRQTAMWDSPAIDPAACKGCEACARFCPSGALKAVDFPDDDRRTILIRPGRCLACGLCRDICTTGALTLPGSGIADLTGDGTYVVTLPRPAWKPNTPDQIHRKFVGILGEQNNVYGF